MACSAPPPAPAPVQPGTLAVAGVVRDEPFVSQLGAPVAGATVALTYIGTSNPERSAATAPDGTFQIGGVRAGEAFQLTVNKGGYYPRVQQVTPAEAKGSLEIGLIPQTVILSGRVTDHATGAGVPGARVDVLNGPNRGLWGYGSLDGSVYVGRVWGDFSVAISRTNYQTVTLDIASATDSTFDVALQPLERLARTTFTGDLCTIVLENMSGMSCNAPKEQRHTFEITRPGKIVISTEFRYVGDYHPNYLSHELRCGSQLVRAAWTAPSEPVTVEVSRPCVYDLRLFDFIADTKGGVQTTYRVLIEHQQ